MASDLLGAKRQTSVKVVGAKVSYANFAAIRRDFPHTRTMSEAEIANWVLDNFAYISEEQLKLNGIRQGDIPVDRDRKKANFRPASYRRASVMKAEWNGEKIGLVDIKGSGLWYGDAESQVNAFREAGGDPAKIDAVRTRDHSDGLMRHGEAVAEAVRQTAVQRLFDIHNNKHGTDHETVETYFVIELPFNVLGPNGGRDRAALYGRQAHWRGTSDVTVPDGTYRDPFGGRQATIFRSSVDFGGVLVDQDPRLKDSFGAFPGQPENDPQKSKPWAWGHDTARAFERGDTSAVYRHIEEMLQPIAQEWRGSPPSIEPRGERLKQHMELIRIAKDPRATKEQLNSAMRLVDRVGEPRGVSYSDTEEQYVRRTILSQMSPANVAKLLTWDPGRRQSGVLASHASVEAFLAIAYDANPEIRQFAVGLLPAEKVLGSPEAQKALLDIARKVPEARPAIAGLLEPLVPKLIVEASTRGQKVGEHAATAIFTEIGVLGVTGGSPESQWGGARLLATLRSSAPGETLVKAPDLKEALSFLRARAGNGGEDRERFEAVRLYEALYAEAPHSPSLPSPDDLRREVHDGFLAELRRVIDPREALGKAQRLAEIGMKDERLIAFRLITLKGLVEDDRTSIPDRARYAKEYRSLRGTAPTTSGAVTADQLEAGLLKSVLGTAEKLTPSEKLDRYRQIENGGLESDVLRRAQGEALLLILRDRGLPFESRHSALNEYKRLNLEQLGGSFPTVSDLETVVVAETLTRLKTLPAAARLKELNALADAKIGVVTLKESLAEALREATAAPLVPANQFSSSHDSQTRRAEEGVRRLAIHHLLVSGFEGDLAVAVALRNVLLHDPNNAQFVRDELKRNTTRLAELLKDPHSDVQEFAAAAMDLRALRDSKRLRDALRETIQSSPHPRVRLAAAGRMHEMARSYLGQFSPEEYEVLKRYFLEQLDKHPADPLSTEILPLYAQFWAHFNNKDNTLPARSEVETKVMKAILAKADADPHGRIEAAVQLAKLDGMSQEIHLFLAKAVADALKTGSRDALQVAIRRNGLGTLFEAVRAGKVKATPEMEDLLLRALESEPEGSRRPILEYFASYPSKDASAIRILADVLRRGEGIDAIYAATALAAAAKGDPDVHRAFADAISRKDLSPADVESILSKAREMKIEGLHWAQALKALLGSASTDSLRSQALREAAAHAGRTATIDVDLIRTIAQTVNADYGNRFYGSAPEAALKAIAEMGLNHEDVAKALAQAADTRDEAKLAAVLEAARAIGLYEPKLVERARKILTDPAGANLSLAKAAAEFRVSQSPFWGAIDFRRFLKGRPDNYDLARAGFDNSPVRRVRKLTDLANTSSTYCGDIWRAMNPWSFYGLGERALVLGPGVMVIGTLGGGGYLVYSMLQDGRDERKGDRKGSPESAPHPEGVGSNVKGAVLPNQQWQRRSGEYDKACLEEGGSIKRGICICEPAKGVQMNPWTEKCVKYR